ncbi:zinc-dependent metalloprotease [uncultured Dokdonia sp.]|uniref:zinc-dependent metalloprotease n=1 Tax=uncultured Dokdonia sp. TaxID=575653 RepID=UPI002619582A|nr:zinc-dependent metalloprotease [uncultured Dokdonia sp.]
MRKTLLVLCIAVFYAVTANAQFLEGKKDLQTQDGYFKVHYDESADKLYLEVDKIDQEFLYVHSLRTGLGSNDIGLDRGQLGGSAIVYFKKAGNKLLLVQPNQNYRANTSNELERKSIQEAFATSVLYGFPIKETKGNTYVIDVTPFLMEDTHGVASRLKFQKEGNYKIDKNRSALAMERTKSFPKNTEFEALLTFKGQPTGRNIRSVAPDASSVSLVQHYSFVELPDDGYTPRAFDPRAGNISTTYLDYATPVQEPIRKRYANRHRLLKKNPNAAVSEAVEPIIYYLDPGTPEPVRSALLEGASWWNQAYEAIGFKDAFQVKMLPENADPMDLRYNVIQWVHRSTRGWSYGASVTDPRTGEIIKGHVSLGSLRIRQDFLIAQALMNKPFAQSDDNYQPMLEMALARIRQLSAHEVGHTIGFAHNFAASPNGRASVMDYPHPTLRLKNGTVDFSDAYATGIGEWDKVTVAYSYGIVPTGVTENDYLNNVLETAEKNGLRYITDSDARPQGGAHYKAHLWDNGTQADEELENVLELRKHAIANFSVDNIRTNEPYSVLEDVFVPLYFYHRYQTEAAVKMIGGLDYNYAIKGDTQIKVTEVLDAKAQKQALESVLKTLKANALMIPKDKLALFPPRAHGYNRTRESFKSKTGVAFDALGAPATASDMTLGLLLHPERANRLVQQKALDAKQLGLQEMLEILVKETLNSKEKDAYKNEVQTTVNYNVVKHLLNLYVHPNAIPQTKATVKYVLRSKILPSLSMTNANDMNMIDQIKKTLDKPETFKVLPSPKIPDGSPIGCFQE